MRKEKFHRQIKYAFISVIGQFINPVYLPVFVIFIIAVSWIPDGLTGLLALKFSHETIYIIQLSAGFFTLLVLFLIGYFYSRKYIPKIEIYSKNPDKKKHLILFLSYNRKISDIQEIKSFEELKNLQTNWQMPVEAIKYHLPELKNLFVILSGKSKNQFNEFQHLVKRLFSGQEINIIPVGLDREIDFENIEDLNRILEEVYQLARDKYKAKDRDIIIDITGGQKLVSIIGAMQTLTHDREFQYISTTDYTVKSFDIRYYQD